LGKPFACLKISHSELIFCTFGSQTMVLNLLPDSIVQNILLLLGLRVVIHEHQKHKELQNPNPKADDRKITKSEKTSSETSIGSIRKENQFKPSVYTVNHLPSFHPVFFNSSHVTGQNSLVKNHHFAPSSFFLAL